jgi:hypothetical protein
MREALISEVKELRWIQKEKPLSGFFFLSGG